MKLNIFLFLLVCFNTYAQTISIDYSENRKISAEKLENIPRFAREEVLKPKLFNLIYSNGKSLYKAIESSDDNKTTESKKVTEKQTDDLVEINTVATKITSKKSERFFFKNYINKEMLFVWPHMSDNIYGKDTIQNWDWNIIDETKTIEGFKCKKAISNWLGYDFTAWYTEDIAISIGPDRFDGLPGLILYVSTPNFEWKVVKINQTNNETKIEEPNFENKKIKTLSEINDIFINKMKNHTPSKTITQDGNTTITRENTIIK